MASLFSACKSAVRDNSGGTFNIGGYDIDLELYHQSDIDADVQYGDVTFGDNDESKIVVVADNTITIPEGYTLTPDSPKKSLVIFCNNLVNNGTISMYQKAPNVLPHDYFILESNIAGTARNIVIPAYANNAAIISAGTTNGINGTNGTNRNCGSGGTGSGYYPSGSVTATSGSGYAFGGGAGSGGFGGSGALPSISVNTTYPMRGSNGVQSMYNFQGGVGNPSGLTYENNKGKYSNTLQNFGCGGRIIIFCYNFTNNGIIIVNGTDTKKPPNNYFGRNASDNGWGGASGAGAIDIFYTNKIIEGTMTANGGGTFTGETTPGKGGNGSITLTQWTQSKVVKETVKYFSASNIDYLLTQLADRIKDSRMGE